MNLELCAMVIENQATLMMATNESQFNDMWNSTHTDTMRIKLLNRRNASFRLAQDVNAEEFALNIEAFNALDGANAKDFVLNVQAFKVSDGNVNDCIEQSIDCARPPFALAAARTTMDCDNKAFALTTNDQPFSLCVNDARPFRLGMQDNLL